MEEKEGGIKRGRKRGGVIKEKQEGDRVYKNERKNGEENRGMMGKLMREELGEMKEK